MRLSREDIAHVALLSRLKLSDDEVGRFTEQLNSILGHFEALQRADTGAIAGTTHVVPMVNVLREDKARACLDPDVSLANAPERIDDYFKVPRVVE